MDCSICFETVDAQFFTWLKCSHCLCNACFEKLTQSLCPFCREIIDDDEQGSTNTILSSPIITSTNREETSILYSIFHGVSSPFQIDDDFDNSFITEYDVWDVEINRRHNSRRRRNQDRNQHRSQGRNNRQRIMNSILPNSFISNSENNTNNTQESTLIEIPNIVNEVERNRASNRWNSIRNQISRFMRNR
jgi:hypothetical protein